MNPEEMFDAFINGRLTHGEWTHEAHLITCWVALRNRTAPQTLGFLRDSIQRHNCGIGIANTQTSGYHETLTVYYVSAVDHVAAPTLEVLFDAPECSRKAPLAYWNKDSLFSTEARMAWLAPDIAWPAWAITETLDAPAEAL